MVGMLIGQENSTIGFIVHLGISAIIGAIYGAFASRFASFGGKAVAGILSGVIWWVVGALILIPFLLGMNQMILQ